MHNLTIEVVAAATFSNRERVMLSHIHELTRLVGVPGTRWKDVSAGRLDWDSFLEAKRQELKRLNKIYRDNLQT